MNILFTVLIADDEKLLRAGIRKILYESFTNLNILEAKNGQEALELIQTKKIDMLLTDIRMPVMNGIELMNRVMTIPGRPRILVLSGYDEFTYAREALVCGASTYILKPIDREELLSAIQRTMNELTGERRRTSEALISRILADSCTEKFHEAGCMHIAPPYRCVLIQGCIPRNIKTRLENLVESCIVEVKKYSLLLLVSSQQESDLCQICSTGNLSIALSDEFSSLWTLRNMLKQAYTASFQRFFSISPVYYYSQSPESPAINRISSGIYRLVQNAACSDQHELCSCIEALFSSVSGCHELYSLYELFLNDFIRYYDEYSGDMYLLAKRIMLEESGNVSSLVEWKKNMQDYVLYLNMMLRRNTTEYPFIAQAIAYIQANFTKDINMASAANHVSINYTYFSEKFREHTGINFNEYLKRLRLEEAKSLLADGYYKVYEVAERSGFPDVKYFTRIFRDATGITPGEYRKRNIYCVEET